MDGLKRGNRMPWRWAAASQIGSGHIRAETRLQDAYAVSRIGDDHIFAVVSDGAGSSEYGGFGAWLVCRFLTVRFREWLIVNGELPNDEVLTGWVDNLRDQISAISELRGSTPRQFASTLAAILISPTETLTMHVGDSAVVGRRDGEWDVLCWPENGEYASTTYFVTDDPAPRLRISRQPRAHNAFAIFSDGVGDLALSHAEECASSRFFDPMMSPVDSSNGIGRLPELSSQLEAYLAGPAVCARTDDDKTLILISEL